MKMKRVFVAAMGLLLALTITACLRNSNDTSNGTISGAEKEETENALQLPNPFQDCNTLKEAVDIAGFEMEAPERIDGYANRLIQAIDGEMIQVIFYNGDLEEGDLTRMLIRKGTGNEDISGDYNDYTETRELDADGVIVTTKGNEDKINVAIWSSGGFSYAIDFDEGADTDTVIEIVKGVR